MIEPALVRPVLICVGVTALILAAIHDLATRIVPDRLPIIVAVAGSALNGLEGRLLLALLGAGMVFAAAWQCWRRDWIGGGDVKLLTASALLVRPQTIPELILMTALAGAAFALCDLMIGLARSGPSPPWVKPGRNRPAGQYRITHSQSLPYAGAIAAGVLLTLWSPLRFGSP